MPNRIDGDVDHSGANLQLTFGGAVYHPKV